MSWLISAAVVVTGLTVGLAWYANHQLNNITIQHLDDPDEDTTKEDTEE